MGKAVWFVMISLDGFESDRNGKIDFHTPSDEVHRFIDELNEKNAVHIFDKQGYEIMKYWDNPPERDLAYPSVRTYAEQWKQIRKIIVGRHIHLQTNENYELWDELTPARADSLLHESEGDIMVGAASLAREFLFMGKLHEIQIITVPILLGSGERNYSDAGEIPLELADYKIFGNGWTYMQYRVISPDKNETVPPQ
jgi:dihydrofolate reductase